MKLLAVEIVGFGKWQQQKITFESGNQLLYAQMKLASPHCINSFKQCCLVFPKGKRNAITHLKWWFVWWSFVVGTSCVWGSSSRAFKRKNKGQAIIYYQQQMGMKNLTANVTSANEKVISRGFYFPTRTINYE